MQRDHFDAAETAREQFEIIDQLWDSVRRRLRVAGAAILVLAAILGATVWYGYGVVRREEALVANLSAQKKAEPTAGESPAASRGGAAETTKAAGTGDGAPVPAATSRTTAAAGSAANIVPSSSDALKAKLAELEAAREQDQDLIRTLREQLVETKQLERKMPGPHPAEDVEDMAGKTALDRINFDVPRGHSRQLAPGISIGVNRVDPSSRKVDGWLWVMPDRRTIWLRGQGAPQQIVFYGLRDGKKRELVITRIANDAISGYLLLPKETTLTLTAR